jgi:hypothetical protein
MNKNYYASPLSILANILPLTLRSGLYLYIDEREKRRELGG